MRIRLVTPVRYSVAIALGSIADSLVSAVVSLAIPTG